MTTIYWLILVAEVAVSIAVLVAIIGGYVILRRLEVLHRWWAEQAHPDVVLP